MATVTELLNALPPRLIYLEEAYYLNWSVSRYDSRCIQVCYRNSYDEVLAIDTDYFFVESERHYAVYTIIQNILYYAEYILGYIYYQDQAMYSKVLNSLYDNSMALHRYCTVNPTLSRYVESSGHTSVIM